MTTYDNVRLINMILNLYYIEKMKQSDIAARLDLSTAKVNRLLQQARDQGYIEFVIKTPFQHLFELENRLKAVFGLQDAIVIPAVGNSSSSLLNAIGTVAAKFLVDKLRDGDILGIAPGTSVQAVAESLDTNQKFDIEIVPLLGAIQGEIRLDMNYLGTDMAEKLGSKSYQLHAPAFLESKEHRDTLASMNPVKNILSIARKANIALLGVGTVDPEASRFVQYTALSPDEMLSIANDCGAVGEIAAHVYDIDGEPCSPQYSDRTIGLNLDEIRNIPYRIGVAASAAKALPIYGAMRGGYLHAIITDEAAARGALDLFDKEFRKKP